MTIDFEALASGITLSRGFHASPENGLCAMEMVAWLAGEPHTDRPECACPFLTGWAIALNDASPDDERSVFLRFVPRLLGSRDTGAIDARRRILAQTLDDIGDKYMWFVLGRLIKWCDDTDVAQQAVTRVCEFKPRHRSRLIAALDEALNLGKQGEIGMDYAAARIDALREVVA